MTKWISIERPGYFGRRRDEKIAAYDKEYGKGKWRLAWITKSQIDVTNFNDGFPEIYIDQFEHTFEQACVQFYEQSYFDYLVSHPRYLDEICLYKECIDNAETNIQSGCDYTKQESYSTHIQDIAIRNVLRRLDLKFKSTLDQLLVIRSSNSNGHLFGPGNVPFYDHRLITQPSLALNGLNRIQWRTFGNQINGFRLKMIVNFGYFK